MEPSKQSSPPNQTETEAAGKCIVAVRLVIPPDPAAELMWPKNNRIGTQLLCRFLQTRLEIAGVRIYSARGGLEFNRSFYLFHLSSRKAALETIKTELEALGLLAWAQIGWHDERELVFRVWPPQPGRFDMPSEDLEVESKILGMFCALGEAFLAKGEDEQPM